jgi:PDZ domain
MRMAVACALCLVAAGAGAQGAPQAPAPPGGLGLGFAFGTTAEDAPAKGALVTEVYPGTSAAAAGVRPNDVVTAVDGHPLDNGAALAMYLMGLHGLHHVVMQIVRPSAASSPPMTVTVVLSDTPGDSAGPNGVHWSVTIDGKVRNYIPDRSIEVASWQQAVKLIPRDRAHESSVWSIYDHPRDHPSSYVIRETVAGATRLVVSPAAMYANTLEEAHAKLPPGSTILPKDPQNPANLIEVWIAP